MHDVDYQQVKRLFFQAADLAPVEREDFLRRAAGDDAAVLAETRSLLESLHAAPDFLERLGAASTPPSADDEAATPSLDLGLLLRDWDRYELRECLGVGSQSLVYRASDRRQRRWVAVKLLTHLGWRSDARFRREAEALGRISHPAVVELYDSGAVNGIPYLAMQLVNGPTLSGLPPTIPLAEQVELMCQVAWGLQAAHELGIVHRDVKPSNILVERRIDGALHAYLADFGIARDPAGSRVTRTGDLIGTLSYLAPEHWSGPIRSPDPRSDIYALGLTFYEIFCGVPLRTSVTGDSKADGESRELALAFDAVARLPAALQTILQRCLAVDPDARYPTAGGLAEDLQRFLGRAGRSPSLPGRCGRRGGTRSGLGPAGRAAALLIGGFSLWLAARAKTSSVEDDSGDR